eukprot:4209973-Pyramimonas_sp.AAC.2
MGAFSRFASARFIVCSYQGAGCAGLGAHQMVRELEGVPALGPNVSMMSLFVGLDLDDDEAESLALPTANTWRFPSTDHDANWQAFHDDIQVSEPRIELIDAEKGAKLAFSQGRAQTTCTHQSHERSEHVPAAGANQLLYRRARACEDLRSNL